MNEVDLIIHYMRQSKMDAVRKELTRLLKSSERKSSRPDMESTFAGLRAQMDLSTLKGFFQKTSNNAPLP